MHEMHGRIAERLVVASAPDGRRYELWRTPQLKPGWHLYCYVGEVEQTRKPMASETKGRERTSRRGIWPWTRRWWRSIRPSGMASRRKGSDEE
jgi:hypothetical protein